MKIKSAGQSLIELLIVITMTGIFLPGLITGLTASREGKAQQQQREEAYTLLKEGEEAVRTIREADWANITENLVYHPEVSGNTYTLVQNAENINGFIREITIGDVYRDAGGNIAESGNIDPSTKKITTTVSWTTPRTSNVSSIIYLGRHLNNAVYTQTTEAEFNTGTINGVTVTNTAGGEIILGAGGQGLWCAPELTIAALDLPKSGVANAISAVEGHISAGTGDNASGVSYAHVSITNENPPSAAIAGTFDGYKTNDVWGDDSYAYVATDTNSEELVIIRISSLPYVKTGYFDIPGASDGMSVYVSGNTGYVLGGNTLYTFDLSSKSGSRPLLDSIDLTGTGVNIVVKDNYAYVALSSGSRELQIINVTNPGNLTDSGYADINASGGKRLFINDSGTRAYLATGVSSTQKELFIIDITGKTGNRPVISSYEANGMNPKGITVVPGNKAILVGNGGEEYQVIDITNENNPARCGGLEINSGINGISTVLEEDGDAFSYIITGDASEELKIIAGGPGGQYSTEGTFESQIFDAGGDAAFNRLDVTSDNPPSTTMTYQVAVAAAPGGDCNSATYYYIGPDGTQNSYYSSGGAIALLNNGLGYVNPGRCLKFKAYLNTAERTQTPVLYDMSINYSP